MKDKIKGAVVAAVAIAALAVGEARRHPLHQLAELERFGPHGQLPLVGARHHQQVLGHLREVIALLERRDQAFPHLRVVAPGP